MSSPFPILQGFYILSELRLYMTKTLFSDMGFNPDIERALQTMGFEEATSIQSEAIPPIRAGRDVLARSQTGTGKTLAFAIPAIESIVTDEKSPTVQVLVLCPTRELAQQAGDEIRKLARYIPEVRPVEIFGGAAIDKQCIRLRHANIVIGTPGRIMDHMSRKTLKLGHLKMIILDEADEMLNMGFKEDIETILRDVPEARQTVLFSATMPPAILALTKDFQRSPVIIETGEGQATLDEIEQKYIEVPHSAKTAALVSLMELNRQARTLVFCNTKTMVDEITAQLRSRGFSAESIHSDIRQAERTSVMQGFKHGKTDVLVATDIAARGIDVKDIDFVINFDLPPNAEYYIHRIGRTGRAGKPGCSITICGGPRESAAIRRLVLGIDAKIVRIQPPTAGDVEKSHSAELAGLLEKAICEKPSPMFSAVVNQLTEKGHSGPEIAEAALRLGFSAKYSAIPKIPEGKVPRPVVAEKKRVSGERPCREYAAISIDLGAQNNIKKNHILGAMIERTGLTASDIGKIEIFHEQTVVEVPPESVDATVKAMAGCSICGKTAHTEKLSGVCKPVRRQEGGSTRGKKPFSKTAKPKHAHK
ncbi:MAG: DEAD/DEAH box helicase [Clostridia bacterium]|nr:DEAD/DEAH box helicase [Clostridia bacterium]